MSDFITHLLDRHLGKEEMVQPLVHSRFEPGTAAAFLFSPVEDNATPVSSPVGDTGEYQKTTSPHKGFPEEGKGEPGETVSKRTVSKPTGEHKVHPYFPQEIPGRGESRIIPNHTDLNDPLDAEDIPSAIHDQPNLVIPAVGVRTPVHRPLSGEPLEPMNKEPLKEKTAPVYSRQEIVRQEGPGNKEPDKAGVLNHVIPVVMLKTQGETTHRQPRQRPAAAPEPSPWPGNPGEQKKLEPIMETPAIFTEPQETGPGANGLFEVPGWLEVPAWAAGKQPIFPKESLLNYTQPEKEPVINVTIGRIEVRAIRSPVPEPHRQPKKPSGVMTLDQYLSRSKQGGSP